VFNTSQAPSSQVTEQPKLFNVSLKFSSNKGGADISIGWLA